ncbi:MAG: MATE family efflux transporter [Clostridia bacterium]|jgi:Na+-driven multidrug efflux pump|nr:MATE family efflux transporter [Clostridia bacterium]
MNKKEELEELFEKKSIRYVFFKYFIPLMLSFFAISAYTTADAYFVKKYLGTSAFEAIGLAFPMVQFLTAITLMLSVGASVVIEVDLGKGDYKEANKMYSMMLGVTIITSIIAMPLLKIISDIVYLNYDVSLQTLNNAKIYSDTLILTTIVWCLSQYYISIGRVIGKPMLISIAIIIGNILNIVFDYVALEYFNMGIEGVIYATGASSFIMYLIARFAVGNKVLKIVKFKWNLKKVWFALYNGFSDLVSESTYGITQMLFMIAIIKYVGQSGVESLTFVNTISNFLMLTLYAISVAISQAVSYDYGAGDIKRANDFKNLAIKYSIIFGVFSMLVLNLFVEDFIGIFGITDENAIKVIVEGMALYSLVFIVQGYNNVLISYYTATENAKASAILSILRSFILIAIGINVLPIYLGISGVWLTYVFAEIGALIYYVINKKKLDSYELNGVDIDAGNMVS